MASQYPKLYSMLRANNQDVYDLMGRYYADPWGHDGRLDLARNRARDNIRRLISESQHETA